MSVLNLIQNQDFVLNNAEKLNNELTLVENNQSKPLTASLNQAVQKDNLILVLSIIISASLLFGWVLIQIRKKISH